MWQYAMYFQLKTLEANTIMLQVLGVSLQPRS